MQRELGLEETRRKRRLAAEPELEAGRQRRRLRRVDVAPEEDVPAAAAGVPNQVLSNLIAAAVTMVHDMTLSTTHAARKQAGVGHSLGAGVGV